MTLIAQRTPAQRMEPVPMNVGDGVQFEESKRWWKVRAASKRFVILTSPLNLRAGVLYAVIDWERGLRGPDDHYGVGYGTQAEIDVALSRLNSGDIAVSSRAHSIRVRITRVRSTKEATR